MNFISWLADDLEEKLLTLLEFDYQMIVNRLSVLIFKLIIPFYTIQMILSKPWKPVVDLRKIFPNCGIQIIHV